MPTPKPYSGTSVSRLTALVNGADNNNLVYGLDFTFGVPEAIPEDEARNTKVDIIPLRNVDKYLKVTVDYIRLPLNVLNLLPPGFTQPVPIYTVPFTIHAILPRINAALGLNLIPEEVENTVYDLELASYSLTMLEGSLAWLPSTVDFAVEHVVDIPLSDIITVTTLNGLIYNPQ